MRLLAWAAVALLIAGIAWALFADRVVPISQAARKADSQAFEARTAPDTPRARRTMWRELGNWEHRATSSVPIRPIRMSDDTPEQAVLRNKLVYKWGLFRQNAKLSQEQEDALFRLIFDVQEDLLRVNDADMEAVYEGGEAVAGEVVAADEELRAGAAEILTPDQLEWWSFSAMDLDLVGTFVAERP